MKLQLDVPNDIYNEISDRAKEDSRATGEKKSIAKKTIEMLSLMKTVNPDFRFQNYNDWIKHLKSLKK